jgi:DNA mismatch endonuclease (patch repair protein)
VAVFVDGCFWHQCPEHGSSPKTNTAYWEPKLARNVARDRLDDAALTKAGWSVVRIWEHVDPEEALARVERALRRATRPGAGGMRTPHRPSGPPFPGSAQ